MHIDVIDTLPHLDALRDNWELVRKADMNAHVFSSWAWLREYFQVMPCQWCVLAYQPQGHTNYVAFLPLAMKYYVRKIYCTVRLGGNPIADYTGFICDPVYEDEALPELATFLKQRISWERIHLRSVLDTRLNKFLENLPESNFNYLSRTHSDCFYISLPDKWEMYLSNFLSRGTRSKLKRRIKKLTTCSDFHITHIEPSTVETHIATVLQMWQNKWGMAQFDFQTMLIGHFKQGLLWSDIFWLDDVPIAGMIAYQDKIRKTFSILITTFNVNYQDFSPGRVMFAHSIQYAIENGYQIYDFLRGDESYKSSYGANVRKNQSVSLSKKSALSVMFGAVADIIKERD